MTILRNAWRGSQKLHPLGEGVQRWDRFQRRGAEDGSTLLRTSSGPSRLAFAIPQQGATPKKGERLTSHWQSYTTRSWHKVLSSRKQLAHCKLGLECLHHSPPAGNSLGTSFPSLLTGANSCAQHEAVGCNLPYRTGLSQNNGPAWLICWELPAIEQIMPDCG